MQILDKNGFLALNDIKIEKVELPKEYNASIYIRVMDGKSRGIYENHCLKLSKKDDVSGIRSLIVQLTVCDERGNLLFDKSDIDKLEAKSANLLDFIYQASSRINKINDAEVQKEVERFQAVS